MEVFHQVSGFIDTEGHREKQRNTEKDCQCVFKLTKNTKDTKERRRGGFPAKTQGAREARWANAGRFAGETPADRSLPPIVFALGNSFNSLRHITKLRGRTHRTYRTTRTAAPPLDSQLPKAWRAKPAMPLQAPGPDVCLTHTHGPPLRTCWHVHRTCRGCRENFSLPGRGAAPHISQSTHPLIIQNPFVSFVSLVISKTHWQSSVR